MSKVLPTIKAMLTTGALLAAGGVMFAALFVVIALFGVFAHWLVAWIRFYPHDLFFPTIGEAYASFPAGKELLLGGTILSFCIGLFWYPSNKWENVRWIKRYDRSRLRAAADTVSDEKVFYHERSDLWSGLITGSILSVTSLGALYFPIAMIADSGGIGYVSIALAAGALGSAAFFSSVTRFYFGIIIHRGPALVIGPLGIQAHQLSPDTISWGEIARVQCFANQIRLTLVPFRRPHRSLVRRRISHGKFPWPFGRGATKLVINLRILLVTQEDMVQAIGKFAPEMDLCVRR